MILIDENVQHIPEALASHMLIFCLGCSHWVVVKIESIAPKLTEKMVIPALNTNKRTIQKQYNIGNQFTYCFMRWGYLQDGAEIRARSY